MEENKTGFFESFRKKVLANRIAIESILFEKDKPKEKEKKDYKYIWYLVVAISIHILLNVFYFSKNQGMFSYSDLKSFEYLENYLKSNFVSILSFLEISYANFDMPLYYLCFLPFSKFVALGYSYSLLAVNSICVIAISIGIYLFLLESRNKKSALTGVVIFLSSPFVFELSRKFSPVLLTMVFVTWSYYLYIKTEKFEKTNLIPFFIVMFSLGFLSDKFFIFYIFPIFGFLSYLFTTVYSHLLIKIFLPIFLISLVFYIRFIILSLGFYVFQSYDLHFFNFKKYFHVAVDSVGILYFVLIFGFFMWTIFVTYMKYEPKKVLIKWALYPLVIFSLFPFVNKNLIYPSIIALLIGGSVTILPVIRKYVLYGAILVGIITGVSVVGRVDYSGYRVFGIDTDAFRRYHIKDIMLLIKEDIKIEQAFDEVKEKSIHGNIIVSINSGNEFVNYYAFNSIKNDYGLKDVRFVRYPDYMRYFSDYIITDNAEDLSMKGVFDELLMIKNIKILKKRSYYTSEKDKNFYFVGEIKIGEILLRDVRISVYGFDEKKNYADYAVMTAGYANYRGVDIYGLKLKFDNFKFSDSFPSFVSGFSDVEIVSAKISDFSLIRFLEDNLNFKNIEIEFLNKTIKIKFSIFGYDVSLYSSLTVEDNKIYFKVFYMDFGYFKIPRFLCYFLNFKYDLNNSGIPLKINRIIMSGGIVEIK